jgi:hypothetical protein
VSCHDAEKRQILTLLSLFFYSIEEFKTIHLRHFNVYN